MDEERLCRLLLAWALSRLSGTGVLEVEAEELTGGLDVSIERQGEAGWLLTLRKTSDGSGTSSPIR